MGLKFLLERIQEFYSVIFCIAGEFTMTEYKSHPQPYIWKGSSSEINYYGSINPRTPKWKIKRCGPRINPLRNSNHDPVLQWHVSSEIKHPWRPQLMNMDNSDSVSLPDIVCRQHSCRWYLTNHRLSLETTANNFVYLSFRHRLFFPMHYNFE